MEKSLYGRYEYCINSYLADCKSRASLPALFMLLQESAWKHAETHDFGWEALSKNELFWVLSRIKVRIDEYPKWKDCVLVETWSKPPDALMAYRDFEMMDGKGEKILSATSAWLILNRERRPQRMTFLDSPFHVPDRKAMDCAPEKLPRLDAEKTTVHTVKTIPYSAMDVNGHVNNTLYLQWVIDEFPEDYIMNHEIREAEINYLHESVMGQRYCVHAEELLPDEYLCSVLRCPDNKELAKMKLKFGEKQWSRKP